MQISISHVTDETVLPAPAPEFRLPLSPSARSMRRSRLSEAAHHLHVWNPGFVEDRTARREAGPAVERRSAQLGVQHRLAVAALTRSEQQRIEHRMPDTAAADCLPYRHTTDLRDTRDMFEQTPRCKRGAEAIEGDGVDRAGVGIVPFHVGRNALFVDEDLGADLARLSAQRVPVPGADVDHRLAGLERLQHIS